MQGYSTALLVLALVGSSWAGSYDGLYISNGTHILYSARPESDSSIVVHHVPEGRIVGLAFSEQQNFLFWSNIQGKDRGIWRGTLTGTTLSSVQHIVDTDILEINGLAVDWVSKHIYWTDARKGSIELADFDGSNRRILPITGLMNPRGIYADPINGYLYWNDQGSKKIERSFLDGSVRVAFATGKLPNEMIVNDNHLYFVDAQDSALNRIPLSGSPSVSKVATIDTPDYAVFGLAIHDGTAYVSSWNGKVHSVLVPSGSDKKTVLSDVGTGALFSTVYVTQQQPGSNPCGNADKNGCSHLCLPLRSSQSRCACPSYGGLVLQADAKNCATPSNFLFFAVADEGQVGFINVDNANDKDRYLVGRCLRPVAVAFDPIDQFVYWSDVHEHSIHKAKVDGSQHSIFMGFNQSIGVVDGLSVDYVDRRLYYSNMGQVVLGGVAYTWHKIEMADLSNPNIRRTVVETADKPRALHVDNQNRYIYYTDWGDNAAVIRIEMDGTKPIQIKTGLDNPNGVTIQNGKVVVVDSHYKSRASSEYPGKVMSAAIYSSSLDGQNWSKYVSGINILTPFSVTAAGPKIYVSDWDRNAILAFTSDSRSEEIVMEGVSSPMGLLYSPKTVSSSPKCSQGCDTGLCVGRSASASPTVVCTCASYDAEVYAPTNQCNIPQSFLLFADYNSIKMVGLDGQDLSVYTVVQGNRYFSNFVGLAFKEDTETIYFSEENRRGIYYYKLDGSSSGTFYQVDHVIDGLALNPEGNRIYWTDFLGGRIASQTIPIANNTNYVEFVTGLSKPRDIAVTDSHIYWTEWGTNPRVGRSERNGANDQSLVTEVGGVPLKYPNALFIDDAGKKLYIGDRSDNRVIQCELDGSSCTVLKYALGKFNHIYDVIVHNNMIIYSDWVDETVSMISMTTDQVIELASGVMRPTQMYLKITTPPVCPSDNRCSDKCIAHAGGYRCACDPGRVPTKNQPEVCENAYQNWIPADDPSQCSTLCKNQKVCAQQVGTTTYSCSCPAGYELLGSCTACAKDKYKSGIGDAKCLPCPAGASTTGSGSTECQCRAGTVWDTKTEVCRSSNAKTGQCPALSPPYGITLTKCEQSCSSDSDCKGSQKCCSYNVNSTCNNVQTCIDPVGLSECSYEGKLYLIGQSFHPNKCTTCKCEYDRYLGDPRYGNAVCEVETCPILPCSSQEQRLLPGNCCPECKSNSTGIQILNCPKHVVTITLPEDKNFYDFHLPLNVRDNTQQDRNIIVEPSGKQSLLWSKDHHQIKYTATVRNSPDTDTCTVQVALIDNHPPKLTCPADQKVYTSSDTGTVTWDPPQFSEYGSGVATGFPQSSKKYGGQLTVGPHTVEILIEDRAGNKNTCSFQVTVVKEALAICPVPDVKSGYLDCTIFSQEKKCSLQCATGHTPFSSVTSFTCQNDVWTPRLIENFIHYACIEVKQKVVFGRLVLNSVECTEDLQQTQQLIIQHITARYLYAADNPFELKVLVSGCQGDKEMKIDVQMSAVSRPQEDPSALYQKMNEKMDQIQRDIENGMFKSIIPGDNTVEKSEATTRCPPGSQRHGQNCATCPYGTYYDDTSSMCGLCPSGTYQDKEGQLQCKSCAQGEEAECSCNVEETSSSQIGLSNLNQCPSVATTCNCNNKWIIIVVVVVVVVVLLIVIVVIVVVVKRRQRVAKSGGISGANGTSHNNQVFSNDATEYDEIPHMTGKSNNGFGNGSTGNLNNDYESPEVVMENKLEDHGYAAIQA